MRTAINVDTSYPFVVRAVEACHPRFGRPLYLITSLLYLPALYEIVPLSQTASVVVDLRCPFAVVGDGGDGDWPWPPPDPQISLSRRSHYPFARILQN